MRWFDLDKKRTETLLMSAIFRKNIQLRFRSGAQHEFVYILTRLTTLAKIRDDICIRDVYGAVGVHVIALNGNN